MKTAFGFSNHMKNKVRERKPSHEAVTTTSDKSTVSALNLFPKMDRMTCIFLVGAYKPILLCTSRHCYVAIDALILAYCTFDKCSLYHACAVCFNLNPPPSLFSRGILRDELPLWDHAPKAVKQAAYSEGDYPLLTHQTDCVEGGRESFVPAP